MHIKLLRSCGDVDLFFDAENYEKAKGFLTPLASEVEPEDKRKKHLAMTIDPWLVELHGLMPTEISERVNAGVKQVQNDIFAGGGVRVWKNDGADVPLVTVILFVVPTCAPVLSKIPK